MQQFAALRKRETVEAVLEWRRQRTAALRSPRVGAAVGGRVVRRTDGCTLFAALGPHEVSRTHCNDDMAAMWYYPHRYGINL